MKKTLIALSIMSLVGCVGSESNNESASTTVPPQVITFDIMGWNK